MKLYKSKKIDIPDFQNWCIEQGFDVSDGDSFTVKRNRKEFKYFSNGYCNQKMLSLIDFYIKDKSK